MRPPSSHAAPITCAIALLLDGGSSLARPDTKGSSDLWRYAANDVVKSHPSPGGSFRVHYTESGANAVPAGDANANGTPEYVEEVAVLYDQVLAFYKQLGFKAPPDDGKTPGNNGGDARFDVYLLDFAGKADGHFSKEQCDGEVCSGFMVQENDFSGYPYASATIGNRILSSHEFFHAVQAGYDGGQSSILAEGTAVWATEKFDSTLSDLEGFLPGFFDRPDRSLDKPLPGAVDPFSYAMAIWFQFLDEHVGPEVIRELWEDCVDGARGVENPDWFTALPALLQRDHNIDLRNELTTFAKWNLLTGKYADPKRGYARGDGYPLLKMTSGRAPYRDEALRLFYAATQYIRVVPGGRAEMTASVLLNPGQDASSLRLALATRTGSTIGEIVDLQGAGVLVPVAIDTSSVDELIVIAVNTAQSGDSLKGSLCIGSPDEVQPCLPPPPDMGGPAPFDDGTGVNTDGGGCRVGGSGRARGTNMALLVGAALCALVLRRRAREHNA